MDRFSKAVWARVLTCCDLRCHLIMAVVCRSIRDAASSHQSWPRQSLLMQYLFGFKIRRVDWNKAEALIAVMLDEQVAHEARIRKEQSALIIRVQQEPVKAVTLTQATPALAAAAAAPAAAAAALAAGTLTHQPQELLGTKASVGTSGAPCARSWSGYLKMLRCNWNPAHGLSVFLEAVSLWTDCLADDSLCKCLWSRVWLCHVAQLESSFAMHCRKTRVWLCHVAQLESSFAMHGHKTLVGGERDAVSDWQVVGADNQKHRADWERLHRHAGRVSPALHWRRLLCNKDIEVLGASWMELETLAIFWWHMMYKQQHFDLPDDDKSAQAYTQKLLQRGFAPMGYEVLALAETQSTKNIVLQTFMELHGRLQDLYATLVEQAFPLVHLLRAGYAVNADGAKAVLQMAADQGCLSVLYDRCDRGDSSHLANLGYAAAQYDQAVSLLVQTNDQMGQHCPVLQRARQLLQSASILGHSRARWLFHQTDPNRDPFDT